MRSDTASCTLIPGTLHAQPRVRSSNAIAIAHANDQAEPEDFVEIASTLILVFAIGAVVGPMLASGVVELAGPNAFFAYSAVIHFLTAVFAFYRMQRRAGVLPEDKEDFVAVPRASPEVISRHERSGRTFRDEVVVDTSPPICEVQKRGEVCTHVPSTLTSVCLSGASIGWSVPPQHHK